jgi:hypothetical protein
METPTDNSPPRGSTDIVTSVRITDEPIVIFDNFLADPHQLRQLGLAARYLSPKAEQYYPGRNSVQRYIIPGLDQHVSRVAGQTLVSRAGGKHGTFRMCFEGERGQGGVHIDRCHWSGIIYLSLPEHCRGGTDFFRHRRSGQMRAPVYEEDWRHWSVSRERFGESLRHETNDPDSWELVQHVEMKFNRFVLFRPWLFHNAGPGFGQQPSDGRLIYLLFYHAKDWAPTR